MLSRISRSSPRVIGRAFSASAAPLKASRLALAATTLALGATLYTVSTPTSFTLCDKPPAFALEGGKEAATGIEFPAMVDGLMYLGSGVRVKYGFVKVYAVGVYVDPSTLLNLKTSADLCAALMLPTTPKTIRVVMNRGLSVEKYTDAIMTAILPRLNGVDLHILDEFKKLNPPGEMVQGAVTLMTLRGDELIYTNHVGEVGRIRSAAFVSALADVYFGKEPVSPGLMGSMEKTALKWAGQ